MRALRQVALLTVLWLLAWGEVSLANLVSGVAVSAGLLFALPSSTSRSGPASLHLVGCARLAGYVARQLVTSNVVMVREVLRRRPAPRHGVLEHRLRQPSEHVVTLMTSVIALSPGTMTVDVDPSSSTVSVHFLFLDDVAAARASLERLELLVSSAVRPTSTTPPGAT